MDIRIMLANQQELARAYRQQRAERKLAKNRAEKQREKEAKVKNNLKLSEN